MIIRVDMHNIVQFQSASLTKSTKTDTYGSSITVNGKFEITFQKRQELRDEWNGIKNALKRGKKYYCVKYVRALENAEESF